MGKPRSKQSDLAHPAIINIPEWKEVKPMAKMETAREIVLHKSKETKTRVRDDAAEDDDTAAAGLIYV